MSRNGYCHACQFTGSSIELMDHVERHHQPSNLGISSLEEWKAWLKQNTEVREEIFRADDIEWVKRTYGRPFKVEGE